MKTGFARSFSGKVEKPVCRKKTLLFKNCAYSDRKTGRHFCGIRAEAGFFHFPIFASALNPR
jgi:hypothetical protein